jgi:hypothetical protein
MDNEAEEPHHGKSEGGGFGHKQQQPPKTALAITVIQRRGHHAFKTGKRIDRARATPAAVEQFPQFTSGRGIDRA